MRLSVQVDGEIPIGENLGHELLTLRVTNSPRALSGGSEWEGMSGAVVVTDGIVIGAISEHHPPEGPSALTVAPLSAVAGLPDAGRWWDLLGVDPREFVPLPTQHKRRRPAYLATIDEMAPSTLIARSRELHELASFSTGSDSYRWLVGGPWTGKTALAAAFVRSCPGNVDVVAYFLVRRRRDADSNRFIQTVSAQLRYLLDEEPSAADDADALRELWGRARAATIERGRHLLLIADGLDEDDGLTRGLPSVAQLLPSNVGSNSHVLVLSRRYPLVPADVAPEHPLRVAAQTELEQSPHAAKLELRARHDLDALLDGRSSDELTSHLLALLTVARGPLSVTDLLELIRVGDPSMLRPRVTRVVEMDVARVLERTGTAHEPRFVFAHETLRERAEQAFGPDLATSPGKTSLLKGACDARFRPLCMG